jgi:hypothetical protein
MESLAHGGLHHAKATLSEVVGEAFSPSKDVSWYTGDIVALQLLTLGVFSGKEIWGSLDSARTSSPCVR